MNNVNKPLDHPTLRNIKNNLSTCIIISRTDWNSGQQVLVIINPANIYELCWSRALSANIYCFYQQLPTYLTIRCCHSPSVLTSRVTSQHHTAGPELIGDCSGAQHSQHYTSMWSSITPDLGTTVVEGGGGPH